MRAFVEALWPGLNYAGNLTFWFYPSKKSVHVPLSIFATFEEDDIAALHRDNEAGENVYIGLGLRRDGLPPSKQGGKADIVAIPGLALDIDLANPVAHKAKNLPVTDDDAYQIICKAPPPTLIIGSGNGWHCWWLFREPWVLRTAADRHAAQKLYKAFQAPFIARAKELGWHVDNTASIQRVWRVPGFLNKKNDKPVSVLHSSDTHYSREELAAAAPDAAPKSAPAPAPAAPLKEPTGTVEALVEVLGCLSSENQNKKAIEKVLKGESFADKGERDDVMQRVCSTIAWMPEAGGLDAEVIAEILRPSLTVWSDEPDAQKSLEEELAKATDKIVRAQQDQQEKQEKQRAELEPLRRALRKKKPGSDEEEELENSVILHHTIIQRRTSYYVYHFDRGRYMGPRSKDEIISYARTAWQNGFAGLDIHYINAKGERKQKSVPRLLLEYCEVAEDVIGKLYLAESYYDADDNVFYEAIAPIRRDLVAEYDPLINHWLRLLAGSQYEKVLDWIAAVPQLSRQCCSLYFDGASGAGKGLMAAGLARLFHSGGPTPLKDVLGDFNADMFRCPLLFLDEGLPKRKGNVSAEIRSLVGQSSFCFAEKYVSNRTVLGSIRLLIAANNDDVLVFGDEKMSVNDLAAYIGRFLHVHAHQAAADWLKEHNSDNKLTDTWVEGDKLAKHCLWLRDNRKLKPGKRFLVEGTEMDEMHRKILMQGDGLIYEWLARFCSNPTTAYSNFAIKKSDRLVRIGGEKLRINTQGLADCWSLYMNEKDYKKPKTQEIGDALRKLSDGVCRLGPRNGKRPRFYKIRFDLVTGWACENQVGDELAMHRNFNSTDEGDDFEDINEAS
jgi:hypothetical protein